MTYAELIAELRRRPVVRVGEFAVALSPGEYDALIALAEEALRLRERVIELESSLDQLRHYTRTP
jgi:hypothetical protein